MTTIIKTKEDIRAACAICAQYEYGIDAYELIGNPQIGHGMYRGSKCNPCWVWPIKIFRDKQSCCGGRKAEENSFFVFDEEHEAGEFYAPRNWREAEGFVFENYKKKVTFSYNEGEPVSETFYTGEKIALTEADAVRLLNNDLHDGRCYGEYRNSLFSKALPKLYFGLPVWLSKAEGGEEPLVASIDVRLQNDNEKFGGQVNYWQLKVWDNPDNFQDPELNKHYLVSKWDSRVGLSQGAPLMVVKFNGTDFEPVPLRESSARPILQKDEE